MLKTSATLDSAVKEIPAHGWCFFKLYGQVYHLVVSVYNRPRKKKKAIFLENAKFLMKSGEGNCRVVMVTVLLSGKSHCGSGSFNSFQEVDRRSFCTFLNHI